MGAQAAYREITGPDVGSSQLGDPQPAKRIVTGDLPGALRWSIRHVST